MRGGVGRGGAGATRGQPGAADPGGGRVGGGGLYLPRLGRLVGPARVETGAPYLMHGLMLGAAEANLRAEAKVKIADILQCGNQTIGVQVRSRAAQALDQDRGL